MVSYFQLAKPERVAVAVECCYQNTGIATSVAAAVFEGDDLAVAVGVPLFYGMCEAVFLAIYCVTCWKLGWTKAPADENICTVIGTSYEVKERMQEDTESIEVVLGTPDAPTDLIFATTKEGYQIDEVSLESLSHHNSNDGRSRASTGDGDFTIDDFDDNGADGKMVEVEMDVSADLGPHRRTRAYETIDTLSPTAHKQMTASLPPPELPMEAKKSNPVKNALSSLRGVATGRGNSKYTKASAVVDHDDDDDETALPAEGKQID